MRAGTQGCVAGGLLFIIALCAGCATMAERGLLPDVKARPLPVVNLGPEIKLLEETKLDYESRFASLISTDDRAHLFLTDTNITK